jgi:hypothetical protein
MEEAAKIVNMKWVSVILLIVFAFTVIAPMTLFTLTIVHDEGSFLGNLDVCRSAAPAMSSNGEMPCVSVCPFSSVPMLYLSTIAPSPQVFAELILTTRNEHPPRS